MAVTWDIAALDATKTVGSLSDVVTEVHWTATDTDGDYTGSLYGSIKIADASSSSFTAYADITKNTAITWAKAALGSDEVTRIETDIAAQITESKTPTVSSGLPWES
tara:strand:- start:112 stop:432 length:321 start_codon:yes stop_codon:yes gene_type:complete